MHLYVTNKISYLSCSIAFNEFIIIFYIAGNVVIGKLPYSKIPTFKLLKEA